MAPESYVLHADDIHAGFTKTHGKSGEIAVAGSQTEAAYMTRIENIHGIYDHGRISGIFTCRIAVLLYRVDGIG